MDVAARTGGAAGVSAPRHRERAELEAGLEHVLASPSDRGRLELVVLRPEVGARLVVDQAELTAAEGLVGDNWSRRLSSSSPDGRPHLDRQLTLMNARVAALVAGDEADWPLAGDQCYVDFDLGHEHLPSGSLVAIGPAVIEITAEPHTGCAKFAARFGPAALRFVNGPGGRPYRLRGANARVVSPGVIRRGDEVVRLDRTD